MGVKLLIYVMSLSMNVRTILGLGDSEGSLIALNFPGLGVDSPHWQPVLDDSHRAVTSPALNHDNVPMMLLFLVHRAFYNGRRGNLDRGRPKARLKKKKKKNYHKPKIMVTNNFVPRSFATK